MADFAFTELLPLGEDTTSYRKITGDHVSTFDAAGAHVLPPAEKSEVARGIVAHIAGLMEQRRGQH